MAHRTTRARAPFTRFTGTLAALAAAAFALTPLQPAAASAHPSADDLSSSSTVLPRFAPVYMGSGWQMTQTQAVSIAQRFNLIAAQTRIFTGYTAAMRAANPSLRILAYVNGMFDVSSGGTAYPASWYELDASGHKIRSGFGNYLMNPGNSLWASNVAAKCSQLIAQSGYDGCFLDTMGTAPLGKGYVSGLPIDPATGRVWTAPAWVAATSSIVAAVQQANPTAVVLPNGLSNGAKFFSAGASTAPLLAPSGAAMAEIWLRTAGAPISAYPKLSSWEQDVAMLSQAESAGETVLTTTKLFTSATAAQQAQWHKFSLASFLLAADGHSYYSFLASQADTSIVQDYTWDHVAIGTPLGAYAQNGGLFERAFSNGVVAVNPTSSPATISFSSAYTNLDGAQVTSETLAPDTGDVFLTG